KAAVPISVQSGLNYVGPTIEMVLTNHKMKVCVTTQVGNDTFPVEGIKVYDRVAMVLGGGAINQLTDVGGATPGCTTFDNAFVWGRSNTDPGIVSALVATESIGQA